MQPSQFNPMFAAADLLNAKVSLQAAAAVILQSQQNDGGTNALPDVSALLASIYKTQRKENAHYNPIGFALPIWRLIQLHPANPLRSYLLIQNVGAGDLMILFESGPSQVQDFSAAANQTKLTLMQQRAIRVVAGGNFEPLVAPDNAITVFTLGVATSVTAIEG